MCKVSGEEMRRTKEEMRTKEGEDGFCKDVEEVETA